MEGLLPPHEQFERVLKATPNGQYYILYIDPKARGDSKRISSSMTGAELRETLQNENCPDDVIDSAMKAARAALKKQWHDVRYRIR